MKFISLLTVLAMGMIWPISNTALAKKEESLQQKYALPTHVQLRPFPAPTTSRRGHTVPITVFLEAFQKVKIGLICAYQPRIMDAIFTQLQRTPLKLDGRSVDITGVSDRWLKPINTALGSNLVKSVYIEVGARSARKGSSGRLPFNALGCTGIKDFKNN